MANQIDRVTVIMVSTDGGEFAPTGFEDNAHTVHDWLVAHGYEFQSPGFYRKVENGRILMATWFNVWRAK